MAYFETVTDMGFEEKITIRVGICAMNKKSHSRPMKEILNRLEKFDMFEIVVFSDDCIIHQPVESWPICDALISFFSKGFPLNKAIQYSELRKPFVLNDLESQYHLHDRQKVYECLQSNGVSVPRYAVLRRDKNNQCDDPEFQESEDVIKIHGNVFQKPFVEKPVSAEDHNVYIYFPSQAGGGCQQLFRKIGSRSSQYCAQSQVRKTGSYIYEDFMPTEGTDVKVYTVGPEYVHAEARKSPSLDGKVERDLQGKEIRYPVILSAYEKEIANKVCNIFKQTVCGFDLLRANGLSYVCDVNGFSFVKTSRKYYEDCSQVLGHMILQKIAPQLPIPDLAFEDTPFVDTTEESMLELRCVMAIVRHGDRTPKQKMKMEVRNEKFMDLFNKYGGTKEGKLKLKKPKQLQEVLNIVRDLLAVPIDPSNMSGTLVETRHKLEQLKGVLEMYGHFSGINRKIQFKYLGNSRDAIDNNAEEDRGRHGYSSGAEPNNGQPKIHKFLTKNPSLLLIMKWGGELTPFGREQAVEMGKACRCMYPGGRGEYASLPGCGLLRLHSTYRHDLKIYASDEGRVQMTAAAFAKGLLALEGELTPILVHLVRCDNHATKMLDAVGDPENLTYKIKCRLHEFFNLDKDLTEDDYVKLPYVFHIRNEAWLIEEQIHDAQEQIHDDEEQIRDVLLRMHQGISQVIVPTYSVSQIKALKFINNPYKMCHRLHSLVQSLTSQLNQLIENPNVNPQEQSLYHNECLGLMVHRWSKLEKDFKLRNGKFDISLIPDIYDCIKYDFFHNSKLNLRDGQELYKCAKALADVVVPQEYGITKDEKLDISHKTCQHLCRKLLGDLRHADQAENVHRLNPKYSRDIVTPHRHVRTRLYFTSESHIHTMINAIRYGNLCDDVSDEFWKRTMEYFATVPELNYMTQIMLMLYEDPQVDKSSDKRFHIELHFSPGAKCCLEEAAKDPRNNLLSKPAEAKKVESVEGKSRNKFLNEDEEIGTSSAKSVRVRSASDEGLLRTTEESSRTEGHLSVSPWRSGNRSQSECEDSGKLRNTFGESESDGKQKMSKSLESIDAQNASKTLYSPSQSSLSPAQHHDSPDEGKNVLRTTTSSPTIFKTHKGASSLRAALGPVFSVPGVRKLALQSAVPMANVITRQKTMLSSDERFFHDVPDQGEVHSVISSIHPLKTLHGCIPLRQMENFLREVSNFHAPELTPDIGKRRLTPKGLQLQTEKEVSLRKLASGIPQGEQGIDMTEFENSEGYVEKVTTV